MFRFVFVTFILVSCPPLKAQTWTLYTEHFPPYSYRDSHSIKGFSVEFVELIFSHAEIEYELHLYLWARAFRSAQLRPNSVVFSTVRNPQREALFKWIGPIQQIEIYTWHRVQFDRKNQRPRTVIVRGNAIIDVLLSNENIELGSLIQVSNIQQAFGMLLRERADVTYAAENMWREVNKTLKPETLVKISRGERVMLVPAYLAVHPQSDARDVERLLESYHSLKNSYSLTQLKSRYGINY